MNNIFITWWRYRDQKVRNEEVVCKVEKLQERVQSEKGTGKEMVRNNVKRYLRGEC